MMCVMWKIQWGYKAGGGLRCLGLPPTPADFKAKKARGKDKRYKFMIQCIVGQKENKGSEGVQGKEQQWITKTLKWPHPDAMKAYRGLPQASHI